MDLYISLYPVLGYLINYSHHLINKGPHMPLQRIRWYFDEEILLSNCLKRNKTMVSGIHEFRLYYKNGILF